MNLSNLKRIATAATLALLLAACGSKGDDATSATADSGPAAAGGGPDAADISGAGATFPYPIYSKWADAYKKETNIGLNYQSIGSGGGIKQIKAKTVTFGASISFRRALTLSSSCSRASSPSLGSSSTRTVELMLSAPI